MRRHILLIQVLLISLGIAACNQANTVSGQVTLWADEVLSEGTRSYLDLDTGAIGQVEGADLRFTWGSGSSTIFWNLKALNGSATQSSGMSEPGQDGCSAIRDEIIHTDTLDLRTGNHICVITDQGNLSQILIRNFHFHGRETRLEIIFETWQMSDYAEFEN